MIELDEASGPVERELPREVAMALAELKVATVAPTADASVWRVGSVQRVGQLKIAGYDIRIAPKVPISRLFFMLGYAPSRRIWRDEPVLLDDDQQLVPAISAAYIRQVNRAIAKGLLQGYSTYRTTETVVRGRIDFNEQLKRRSGILTPIEVVFDEYSTDIIENQILASAIDRLLRLPQLDPRSRASLKGLAFVFGAVKLLPRGIAPTTITIDRRNEHYEPAIDLARLILAGASIEHRVGRVRATGFLMSVAEVFEDFTSEVIKEALESRGGTVTKQLHGKLDVGLQLAIRPDIAWVVDNRVVAVLDAKYKAEKPAGYPNADVYQMLAYCTRYGLKDGHLVYAAGEIEPTVHAIAGSGIRVHCHAVNLDGQPEQVVARLRKLSSLVLPKR